MKHKNVVISFCVVPAQLTFYAEKNGSYGYRATLNTIIDRNNTDVLIMAVENDIVWEICGEFGNYH